MSPRAKSKGGWLRESKPGESNPNYRHGHNTNGTTREYRAWYTMKRRCNNPAHPKFQHYGGRGITYDPRWNDFREFLADMGPAPSVNHTLERQDVNRNYTKDNCCWATWQEQARNKRATLSTTIDGVTRKVIEWCEVYRIQPYVVYKRQRRGWPLIEAITTPLKLVTDPRRKS